MSDDMKNLYSITQASEYLQVSRQTIYDWLKKGKLYTVEIAGLRFIPIESIKKAKSK